MKRKLLFILFLLLSTSICTYAQNRTITGKVTDGGDKAIPGVSVSVKGTNQTVQTNMQGLYNINVSTKAEVLVFKYLGFADQEIAIKSSSTIDVSLKETSSNLSELVIVGYGTQTKRDVTGSTVNLSNKDFKDQPLPSIEIALSGRAAGVFVNQSSGKLGQAIQVKIRGNSSISAGSQPLYVVDGTPIVSQDLGTFSSEPMNPLANINPDDIESISV